MKYLLFLCSITLAANELMVSLPEAEKMALSQNKEIRIADESVGQYDAKKMQAIVSWLPNFSFGSMYAKLQKPIRIKPFRHETNLFVNQIQVNQPIFSPELLFGIRTAKLAALGIEAERTRAVNDTLLDVRLSYFAVILKERSLAVQKIVMQDLELAVKDQERRLESGRATNFDVNQNQVALAQANSMYHTLLSELKTAKMGLLLVLGVPAEEQLDVEVKDQEISLEPYADLQPKIAKAEGNPDARALYSEPEIQSWIARALSAKPEIKKADIFVQAADAETQNRKGQYLPTIGAFFDYGYYTPTNGEYFKQQYNASGGVQLTWNIFDSFKRELAIREVGHVKTAALMGLEQERESTIVKIRRQIYAIEEDIFAYISAKKGLELAKEAKEEAKIRLQSGSISSMIYRDSMRSYAEAERQVDGATYLLLQDYFQLLHDSGGELGL
ncbi:MAG: TolC family protein [Verrucomicrobia bacterium]|nr:TolC family protein [Verrucomicrobiota bacterium]